MNLFIDLGNESSSIKIVKPNILFMKELNLNNY